MKLKLSKEETLFIFLKKTNLVTGNKSINAIMKKIKMMMDTYI